jgi:hypothetical protein
MIRWTSGEPRRIGDAVGCGFVHDELAKVVADKRDKRQERTGANGRDGAGMTWGDKIIEVGLLSPPSHASCGLLEPHPYWQPASTYNRIHNFTSTLIEKAFGGS